MATIYCKCLFHSSSRYASFYHGNIDFKTFFPAVGCRCTNPLCGG